MSAQRDSAPARDSDPARDAAPARDPAKARWLAITLIRLSGVAFVLVGLLITERRIALPWIAGVVLTVVGFFDVFVMPKILARRWRSAGGNPAR